MPERQGTRDVVVDYVNGRLVPPQKKALIEALAWTRQADREQLKMYARKVADWYTIQESTTKLLALYQKLLLVKKLCG